MALEKPTVGMTFQNFAKVKEFLQKYMQDTNQIFIIQKSMKCSSTCKIKTKLADGIIYHEINFTCKHGNRTHISQGTIRKKR